MNKLFIGTMVIGLLLLNAAVFAQDSGIQWASGVEDQPLLRSDVEMLNFLESAISAKGTTRLVVTFDKTVGQADRDSFSASGLTLQHYLGGNSYFAVLDSKDADPSVLASCGLRDARPILREYKLDKMLYNNQVPSWAVVSKEDIKKNRLGDAEGDKMLVTPEDETIVAVYVLFFPDVDLETKATTLVHQHGGLVRSDLFSINGLVVEIPMSGLNDLVDESAVQYVETPLPKMSELNNENRVRTGASIVNEAPYGLDGSGVTVLVYDGGYGLASHSDFEGRLTVRDSSGLSDHSTHVAGTVGAGGSSHRGMAPGVIIESYGFEQEGGLQQGFLYTDPGDIEADYTEAITTYNVDISNNSIGTNTAPNGYPCDWEGNYGATGIMIDSIVRGAVSGGEPFRIVWANGNERGSGRCGSEYLTTAPPACAKNHITVGALNSNDDSVTYFTSWGPTDDGRMKPDISAPGCQIGGDGGVTSTSSSGGYTDKCGTSMAAPTVTGLASLLLQDYRAQFPELPDFRNSTLKIFFAHTAVDLGNAGPDNQTGYGSVRIQDAIDFMRQGYFLEDTIENGESYSFFVIVDPGDPELKVTMAWDDVPGTANVNPVLVNDLDLRVFSPSGTQAYPWTLSQTNPGNPAVRTAANHKDNIEQVYVENPEAGAWLVEVYGYNVPDGPQPFSICASPELVDCSDAGVISLDRSKYSCESTGAVVRVVDCGLNTSNTVIDTVDVVVTSTSEPEGETITLVETAAESAALQAILPLATTDAPGTLLIAEGDVITATYIDSDTGSGDTAAVTDTAVIDCTPPVVSNVMMTEIAPRSASLTFNTDEAATGTIRFGTTCGSFPSSTNVLGTGTDHSAVLSGLQDSTTYYYVIDVVDVAANAITDDNDGVCYSFTTPDIPDFFTENFDGDDNDIENMTITFTPNGTYDYYDACVEPITELPVDPEGGTSVDLDDDDGIEVTPGMPVSLYGESYSSFYIISNGNLTFDSLNTDYSETLGEHFGSPRISVLWDDLDPPDGGTISWKSLGDRVVVTYDQVREYNTTNVITCQVEMVDDGTIVFSYLAVGVTDGLIGLSRGNGLDEDFYESDMSGYGNCGPRPPHAENQSISAAFDTPVTIQLQATDDGLPEPASLTYIITDLPGNGTLHDGETLIDQVPYSLGGDQVIYTPATGDYSSTLFKFMANDGGTSPDGGDSNEAVVTIDIVEPTPPTCAGQGLEIPANGTQDILLVGYDDGNPNPPGMLTYIITTLPENGYLKDGTNPIGIVPSSLSGNLVTYVPYSGYQGLDEFTFKVNDGGVAPYGGDSNVSTISIQIGGPQVVYSFPMDSDPGWSCTGQWAYGQPIGGGTHNGDPTSGHTGLNVYGYNLEGDYANNLGIETLTTESLDFSNVSGAVLKFWRWLGVESASYDHAKLEIYNGSWHVVWNHTGGALSESSWNAMEYDISAYADGHDNVRLRWTMGITDGGVTYPGWNIDDIEIIGLVSLIDSVPPAVVPGTWQSMADHGPAGELGIPLADEGVTCEPRKLSEYKLVCVFDEPVVVPAGSVTASSDSYRPASAAIQQDATGMVLTMIFTDDQLEEGAIYTIELSDTITDLAGNPIAGDTSIDLSLLIGNITEAVEVNNVNIFDKSLLISRLGQTVEQAGTLCDIACTGPSAGVIDAFDKSLLISRLGSEIE